MKRIRGLKKWILLSLMVIFATMMSVSGEASFTATRIGVNYPTNLRVGQTFSIKGSVTASVRIARAVVTIYDGDGKNCLQRYTEYPNSKVFNITNADPQMQFNKLSQGQYYYRVSVFDSEGYKVSIVDRLFTVGNPVVKPKLTLTGVVTPDPYPEGSQFTMTGTISANFVMKSVVCTIYDSTGNSCLQRYTAKVNGNSYNLRKADPYLLFDKLKAGTYYYRVCAYDQNNVKYRAVNKKFKVLSSASITIKNVVPAANVTIRQGSSLGLGGTITSTYPLTAVKGSIINSTGETVYTKTVKPSAKTYSLANGAIDNALYFERLSAGTYTLKISAKDSKGTVKTLVKRTITVKKTDPTPDPTPTADIQMVYPVPDKDIAIYRGSTYSLGGIVTSRYNLTQVTITLHTAEGRLLVQKSTYPNSKVYIVDNGILDAAIEFEELPVGSYVLKISAKNVSGESKVVMNRKVVVR